MAFAQPFQNYPLPYETPVHPEKFTCGYSMALTRVWTLVDGRPCGTRSVEGSDQTSIANSWDGGPLSPYAGALCGIGECELGTCHRQFGLFQGALHGENQDTVGCWTSQSDF